MKFFVADHHFNHDGPRGIIYSCNRPYKNIWDMNVSMITKHNEIVSKGDVTYFLGDFAFTNKGNGHEIEDIIDKLNGTKILIMGNHDYKNLRKRHLEKFAKVAELDYIKIIDGNRKHKVMLCHYAMATWRASCHGSLHLHGHSHGNLKDDVRLRLDAGVDCHNFYPLSEREVIDIFDLRQTMEE